MGKITQRTTLDFEKSIYLIDHITYDNGIKSIEIIQQYKLDHLTDSSIKINADNLPTILYTLSQYSDGLPKLEAIKREVRIPKNIRDKVASSYLKGVSLKDLAMQMGYELSSLELMLKNKKIEIVPPVDVIRYRKR